MSVEQYRARPDDVVRRLRRVLLEAHFDGRCRETLEGALARFQSFEIRRALRFARRQRDHIATQIAFLSELDRVSEREEDRTVYEEMALLFDEIGTAAHDAANAIRSTDQPSPHSSGTEIVRVRGTRR